MTTAAAAVRTPLEELPWRPHSPTTLPRRYALPTPCFVAVVVIKVVRRVGSRCITEASVQLLHLCLETAEGARFPHTTGSGTGAAAAMPAQGGFRVVGRRDFPHVVLHQRRCGRSMALGVPLLLPPLAYGVALRIRRHERVNRYRSIRRVVAAMPHYFGLPWRGARAPTHSTCSTGKGDGCAGTQSR